VRCVEETRRATMGFGVRATMGSAANQRLRNHGVGPIVAAVHMDRAIAMVAVVEGRGKGNNGTPQSLPQSDCRRRLPHGRVMGCKGGAGGTGWG
jgi:hypothetical protein